MRKEFKYGIGGLIFGFVFCFCLFLLAMTVSASELDELPESENHEIVQDEQSATEELTAAVIDQEHMTADQQPETIEQDQEPVQDEQIDLTAMIPADQLEMLDNWAQELDASGNDAHIEPFASGVIIGELADLLQENVIENDGYTDESWQRYEDAVSAGWDAISNFMIYTNDEVRAVIDELQAAILGLEYPAGHPTFPIDGADTEFIAVGLFSVVGSSAGLAFVNKWQLGI